MSRSFDAHPAQVELSKVFSSVRLLGPPLDDKLVRLVAHLFTPDEAELAVHLPFYYPRPLEKIARRAKRNPDIIKPLLDEMADKKTIVGVNLGYSLLPLIPGMFEYMLMDGRDSDWHRKYAELLIDMFSTGYTRQYNTVKIPAIRNIPVQGSVENKTKIVDADLMSEMIDRHDQMAVVNVCQCRQSMHFTGHECGRSAPSDGCLIFGSFARGIETNGNGRMVSREEMKDVVAERWEKKLVFLTGNVAPESPNAICTCCDCCCHALETLNHYEGMVLMAPPHYLAELDEDKCDNCGKCSRVCNTYAHTWESKEHLFDRDKCIGCGTCVGVCKEGAIQMKENPEYKPPSKGFGQLGLKLLPGTALSGIKVRFSR